MSPRNSWFRKKVGIHQAALPSPAARGTSTALRTTAAGFKLDSISYYEFDEEKGRWELEGRDVYRYDGLQESEIWWGWNDNEDWAIDGKWEYTYLPSGVISDETEYEFDNFDGSWVVDWRWTYRYDEAGQLIEEVEYSTRSGLTELVPTSRTRHTYADGKRTATEYVDYNNSSVEYDYTKRYHYHSNGQIDTVAWFNFETKIPYQRETYHYDESNRLIRSAYVGLDGSGSISYADYEFYNYDNEGRLIAYTSSRGYTGSTTNTYRERLTYNAKGNLATIVEEEWDQNEWKLYSSEQASYVAASAAEIPTLPQFFEEGYDIVTLCFQAPAQEWLAAITTLSETWEDEMIELHYGPAGVSSAGQRTEVAPLVVYPNPATAGQVTLRLPAVGAAPYQVTVRHLTGQLVAQQTLRGATPTLSLDVKAGLYLVEVVLPGQTLRERLLVR